MRRAPEAGDAGGDAGEGVGPRRAGQPHRRGRGVLLVIGVQDEDPVHRPGQDRADLVVLRRHREAHVQEVLGVVQVVARIDERLADMVLVGPGDDRRQLGDQPDRRDLALPRVEYVGAVVVEGRHRADDAADDRHRVRVAAEAAVEIVHLLVEHGVVRHPPLEILHLLAGRQFAVDQQVADLEEMRFLGQLVDRVAAIEQLALVAVDIGDRALAGGGGGKAGVIGEHVALGVELADIDHVRAQCRARHGQLQRLVPEGERCRGSGVFRHIICSFTHGSNLAFAGCRGSCAYPPRACRAGTGRSTRRVLQAQQGLLLADHVHHLEHAG